jgi:hypothetical protein
MHFPPMLCDLFRFGTNFETTDIQIYGMPLSVEDSPKITLKIRTFLRNVSIYYHIPTLSQSEDRNMNLHCRQLSVA